MNRRTYSRCIILISIVCLAIAGLAIDTVLWNVLVPQQENPEAAVGCFALLLSVPLAFLAAVQERRREYVSVIRDRWREMVDGVQFAIDLTHGVPGVTPVEVERHLSRLVDSVRVLASNVHGLYPLEPLKIMHEVVRSIPVTIVPGGPTTMNDVRACVRDCWGIVRDAWLAEVAAGSLSLPALFAHNDVSAVRIAATNAGLIGAPSLIPTPYVSPKPPQGFVRRSSQGWMAFLLGLRP